MMTPSDTATTPTTDSLGGADYLAVEEIRRQLYDGRARLDDFAEAINKSPRTVNLYVAQGMPVEHVGRTPFVVVDRAIAWLRQRKRQKDLAPRPVGRPRSRAA